MNEVLDEDLVGTLPEQAAPALDRSWLLYVSPLTAVGISGEMGGAANDQPPRLRILDVRRMEPRRKIYPMPSL